MQRLCNYSEGGGGGASNISLIRLKVGICCRTGEINQGDIKRLVLKQEVKKVSTWPRYFSINSLQVYVVSMAGLVFKGISSLSFQK